jgi:hypothetical protein
VCGVVRLLIVALAGLPANSAGVVAVTSKRRLALSYSAIHVVWCSCKLVFYNSDLFSLSLSSIAGALRWWGAARQPQHIVLLTDASLAPCLLSFGSFWLPPLPSLHMPTQHATRSKSPHWPHKPHKLACCSQVPTRQTTRLMRSTLHHLACCLQLDAEPFLSSVLVLTQCVCLLCTCRCPPGTRPG